MDFSRDAPLWTVIHTLYKIYTAYPHQLAREDNPIPFITVCSGRQHAFVEAISQIISSTLPAVFENGCGLYFPTRSLYEEYAWHPLLSKPEVLSQFMRVRQKITEEVIASNQARRVPGKEMMLSLHPVPPVEVKEVYSIVTETLVRSQLVASITRSPLPRDEGGMLGEV